MESSFQELYKKGLDIGEQQKQRQKELLKQQKLRRQQEQDDYRPLHNQEKTVPRKKSGKRSGHQYPHFVDSGRELESRCGDIAHIPRRMPHRFIIKLKICDFYNSPSYRVNPH